VGELLYAGKAVEEPGITFDYYQTPWGPIQWVGDPALPWEAHGWMRRPADAQGGRLLADPLTQAGVPVVMALILSDAGGAEAPATVDGWVRDEMDKQGVKGFRVERAWFPLTDQAVTIHDTKMYGTLLARLAPAREAQTLNVLFDGTEAGRVDIPRKDGTTLLVRRTLRSAMGTANFYLALRVERAAPAWPKPLDVGPEADGKEVVVKGAREVVIGLPGDKTSGCVWTIKSVQGEAVKGGAVKAVGTAQFTPTAGPQAGAVSAGVFENTLRVVEKGKSAVELEYRRPWQTDVPAEKTFRVTLDVQEVVGSGAAGKP